MHYRYTAPLDINIFLAILDAMLIYIAESECERESLKFELSEKDKIIKELSEQLRIHSRLLVTDEQELKLVHQRLAKLADILLPPNKKGISDSGSTEERH